MRPKRLTWFITNTCNLKCGHCCAILQGKQLSKAELFEVLDRAYNFGIQEIGLTGGEPLIRGEETRELCLCAVKCYDMKVGFDTNGTLLAEEHAKWMSELQGKFSVAISLEGPNAQVNDHIRGNRTFNRVINALDLLAEYGITTGIAVTLARYNYQHIEEIAKLAELHSVSTISFGRLVPIGRAAYLRDEILTPNEVRYTLLRAYALTEKYDLTIRASGFPFSFAITEQLRRLTREHRESEEVKQYCGMGLTKFAISASGDFLPCPFIQHPLGNIHKSEFQEFWTSGEMERYRKIATSRAGQCSACPDQDICGGCPAMVLAFYGGPDRSDPQCWRKYEDISEDREDKRKLPLHSCT